MSDDRKIVYVDLEDGECANAYVVDGGGLCVLEFSDKDIGKLVLGMEGLLRMARLFTEAAELLNNEDRRRALNKPKDEV